MSMIKDLSQSISAVAEMVGTAARAGSRLADAGYASADSLAIEQEERRNYRSKKVKLKYRNKLAALKQWPYREEANASSLFFFYLKHANTFTRDNFQLSLDGMVYEQLRSDYFYMVNDMSDSYINYFRKTKAGALRKVGFRKLVENDWDDENSVKAIKS